MKQRIVALSAVTLFAISILICLGHAHLVTRLYLSIRYQGQYRFEDGHHILHRQDIGQDACIDGVREDQIDRQSGLILINVENIYKMVDPRIGELSKIQSSSSFFGSDLPYYYIDVVVNNNTACSIQQTDLLSYRIEQRIAGEWILVPDGTARAFLPMEVAAGDSVSYQVRLAFARYGEAGNPGQIWWYPLGRGYYRILVKVSGVYYEKTFSIK